MNIRRTQGFILRGVFILSVLFLFMPGNGFATVAGDCEVCHSRYPEMMDKSTPDKLEEFALRNEICVNCHTGTGEKSVILLGGAKVPVVYSAGVPDKPLAGGNFYYVSRPRGDRKGHNVDRTAVKDAKYGDKLPPGYSKESDPSVVGYDPKRPLACSGSNGCHGNRNVADPLSAILGTHHAPDTPIDGSTSARSFRYLKNTDKVNGVVGFEDDDWGMTASPKDHNEYMLSINEFCTSCHSGLHGRAESEGPWFRHPVGEVIPASGDYVEYVKYSLDAPVGRMKVPEAASGEVVPGSDRIICLSCHLAHSGPYDSALRWDYEQMISGLGGKGGCFTCHTSKAD